MTDRKLNNKVALVTGGAKRVGKAVALRLASVGMDVAITYQHSSKQAKQVVAEIESLGQRALAIEADFSSLENINPVCEKLLNTFGRVDALVNNASCFAAQPIGQVTYENVQHNLMVNALSPLFLIQKLSPYLSAHHDPKDPSTTGRVVNFIDIHVMGSPLKGYLPYNISKAALQEITHTAAMELAPKITVNAIAPGVVAWADSYTEQMKESYMARVPLARQGTPCDAAAAVLYLVRDADYCTGQTIRLDGGRLLT